MISTEVARRILVEIVTGKEPARLDTPEESEMRARLKTECDEIAAKGGIVQIPSEIPDF